MIRSSFREGDDHHLQPRQQGNYSSSGTENGNKAVSAKASPNSTSPAPWLRLKDPRIVRVSRAFGGKDRHSKVCTIRGLRDRRVRLSVPTAIQLYDLQDRLGLNQPSKVVDWLLNAAKHEIDELPPLPAVLVPPPGNFGLNHHHSLLPSKEADEEQEGFNFKNMVVWDKAQGNNNNNDINLLQRTNNHPFLPAGLPNNAAPFGYHWDPACSNYLVPQADHHHHHIHNSVPSSTLSLSAGIITQPYFPNSSNSSSAEASGEIHDHDRARVNSHFHMLSSTSTRETANYATASSSSPSQKQNLLPIHSLYPNCQSMGLPFHFSMDSKLFHSPDSSASQPNKSTGFSSK